MAIFKIHHITKYTYDRPVRESVNEVKIYPYECEEQETLHQDVNVTGQPIIETYLDYWGNKSGTFNIIDAHKEMFVENRVVIRVIPVERGNDYVPQWDTLHRDVENNLALIELATPKAIAKQDEIARIAESVKYNKSTSATLELCSEYIYRNFKYIKGITTVETTVDEILEQRAGVCQDFAHVMLQILRSLRVPSRYVSGYICPNKSGLRGEGATHAWVEAWLPGAGWMGIDPTNNTWATDKHVKLAVGRDFTDCTPVKGTFKGPARQQLSVYVSIGYEDGHTFEETNKVRLLAQPGGDQEELIDENFAAQQQQQ